MSIDESFRDRARAELTKESRSLRAQLDELGFGDDGEGAGLDYDSNFADSSQVTAEKSEAASIAGSLREALVDVTRALAKLDQGGFGTCEACGSDIATQRLEAMPTSRHCIDCATKAR